MKPSFTSGKHGGKKANRGSAVANLQLRVGGRHFSGLTVHRCHGTPIVKIYGQAKSTQGLHHNQGVFTIEHA